MWIWDMRLAYAKKQNRVFQAELCLRSTVLETGEVDEEHLYDSPHRIYSLTPAKSGYGQTFFQKELGRGPLLSLCTLVAVSELFVEANVCSKAIHPLPPLSLKSV